jgi:Fe-S-cluster-containing dehydrogenase component
MNIVYVDLDRCVACRNCQLECSFRQAENTRDDGANIWVQVDLDHRAIFTSTCLQCETAPCLAACPAGGLTRDPATRAVVVDRNACLGCGMCLLACPFGHIHLERAGRVASKCDLCGGDPRCVRVCMAQALHFGDVEELAEARRERSGRRLAVRATHREEAAS